VYHDESLGSKRVEALYGDESLDGINAVPTEIFWRENQ
jgi:hypothetical protein